ncbi:hypothetical protein QBC46DRAFT_404512 [Diplogelasinospora grovesii]|uniref:Nudix hydrolase domain-containing protein n=1 Tax=Diplogelasinospora grovesii TaxID=303347 RepID=A0AAN6S910_9PEZI|nr:hypothetical protein QBC46DRAFT_404512 [Diplogelasinospora grovesii]
MAETKMQLEDWLDDLCVRFIINLPKEDLESVERICFQVEEAQWFYEDFIRPLDPTLPSMSLRSFCLRMFQHCPLLAPFSLDNHMRAFEQFLEYKTRIPVRGAILLNEAMDATVLVKGWKKGANWSFPRGKINKNEDDLECAIREVYEETGFDIKKAGLVPKDDEVKYIQISIREQEIRLYVFRNIPMDTVFQPKTRKEISKIQWYKLSELPAFRKKGHHQQDDAAAAANANKFYMVAPFLVPLKKWIVQQKNKDAKRGASHVHLSAQLLQEDPLTEDDIGTQPEPVDGDPSTATSEIETLEGAHQELQRLLKVQPPTQGLQLSQSSAGIDKGEALMAILQKKATEPLSQEPSPHAQLPQTPLDHTYTSAPTPHTPHHHHPTHRMPHMVPPPAYPTPIYNQFAFPGGFIQLPPTQSYGHLYSNLGQQLRRAPSLVHPQPLPPQAQFIRGILPTPNIPETPVQVAAQTRHLQSSLADLPETVQESQQPEQQAPKMAPQLNSHKMSLLNAFKSENRQPNEHKPLDTIPQNEAAPRSGQAASHRPVVWADSVSPQPPNAAAQYLPQPPSQQQPYGPQPRPEKEPIHTGASGPSMPKPVQPTDSHRSALLDIFKKSGSMSPTGSVESTARSVKAKNVPGPVADEEPSSTVPKHVLSTAEALAYQAEKAGASMRMNPELNLPYRAVQILSRPKQPESIQSPDPLGPIHRYGPSASSLGRHEMRNPANSNSNQSSPRGHDMRNPAYSGPSSPRSHDMRGQAHTNQSSPRGPVFQFQAGNEQRRSQGSPLQYQSGGSPHGPRQLSPTVPGSSQGAGPAFQPFQPFQQTFQPYQQAGPSAMNPRRQDSNPEQKQKLLSMFKGPHSPATSISGDEKGKYREKEPSLYDQVVRSGTPRSRVASLASAGAGPENGSGMGAAAGAKSAGGSSGPTSRRGSGTPISPADRDFLLSYLQSVSSGR